MPGSAASPLKPGTSAVPYTRRLPIGAEPIGDGTTRFRVWAPAARRVEVVLQSGARAPLDAERHGYFSGTAAAGPGERYQFELDTADRLLPDPASRFQPTGPHGASEIVDPSAFRWTDDEWRGVRRE